MEKFCARQSWRALWRFISDGAGTTACHLSCRVAAIHRRSREENAAMFGDDLSFERPSKALDPADTATFASHFGQWDLPRQPDLFETPLAATLLDGVYAARLGCGGSAALGARKVER